MRLISLLVAMILSLPVPAQVDPPAKRIRVFFQLDDGSSLTTQLPNGTIDIDTEYGKLKIPIAHIIRADFGNHLTAEEAKTINSAITQLGSATYATREKAQKTLTSMGRKAGNAVLKASGSSDKEVKERAKAVYESIVSDGDLVLPEEDTVVSLKGTFKGMIVNAEFEVTTPNIGKIRIKLESIRAISVAYLGPEDLSVSASYNGDRWYATGCRVVLGQVVHFNTSGMVDMWPTQAGQYMSTPRGLDNAPSKTIFRGGALLGKIGDSVFYVGESSSHRAATSGELYLQVAASTWGVEPSGAYSVKLKIK